MIKIKRQEKKLGSGTKYLARFMMIFVAIFAVVAVVVIAAIQNSTESNGIQGERKVKAHSLFMITMNSEDRPIHHLSNKIQQRGEFNPEITCIIANSREQSQRNCNEFLFRLAWFSNESEKKRMFYFSKRRIRKERNCCEKNFTVACNLYYFISCRLTAR